MVVARLPSGLTHKVSAISRIVVRLECGKEVDVKPAKVELLSGKLNNVCGQEGLSSMFSLSGKARQNTAETAKR